MARFTVEDIKNRKASSKSDLERLRNMTEAEIHQAALDDPDAQPLTEEQLKQFTRVVHRGGGVYGHDESKSRKQRASK
jgi:glycine cleavage system protein P-like pyridoxal-binding family